jgi:uncharacterized protein HemY
MLELIAQKSRTGEVTVNAAAQCLRRHEWGQARLLLEAAIKKGFLSEPEQARAMLREVHSRMGISFGAD